MLERFRHQTIKIRIKEHLLGNGLGSHNGSLLVSTKLFNISVLNVIHRCFNQSNHITRHLVIRIASELEFMSA